MKKVLVIDDDIDICALLNRFLSKNNYDVKVAHKGSTSLALIEKDFFDLVLCDFRLPDMDGLEITQQIKKISPATKIIIITGYSDVKVAVNVIKRGAYEYVTKPIHPEEILVTLKEALNDSSQDGNNDANQTEKKSEKNKSKKSTEFSFVAGNGSRSKQMYKLVDLVAPTDMTVVILGETGTGKEVMAKTIHQRSKRKDKLFVALDCGAIPSEIAGSELFGHKKGSFTGAINDKIGHFEQANGGTLFLDEIGNLSYDNQIKLLRVLQERKVKKIGDTVEVDVDVRIIVATNEDLKQMVAKGTFREDLYYRLNEFKIELPALRERISETTEFIDYFLDLASTDLEKNVTRVDDDVVAVFKAYHWPGNLREMKNVIKRATLLATSDTISIDTIPDDLKMPALAEESFEEPQGEIMDLKLVAENAEKKAILNALVKTGYNKSKTAKMLNVDRKTLYNKIASYDIKLP